MQALSDIRVLFLNKMAQRRMFSPEIVCSEEFVDMPVSSRELYFQLGMRADDDGFIQPKLILKLVGASDDDLKVLLTKRFLLAFDDGVVVIKHWLIHNMIRQDRYKPTRFQEQKKTLFIKENKAYTDKDPIGLQNGNQSAPQVRLELGKDRVEINTAPPEGDIDKLLTEKGRINHDFQFVGLEIFEKTGAPSDKKSECMRLAKQYPNLIRPALSFCLDYPRRELKWKMFLWKLNELKKDETSKKNNVPA